MDKPQSTSTSWFRRIAALAVVAALGLGAYQMMGRSQQAPDVVFTSITGEKISMRDLRGKVVMVNFWATSCTTCVHEMPKMAETYNKYKSRGLEYVAVAMSYDPPSYVLNFSQTRQLPFKVALDVDGSLAGTFGDVKMTPTTFLIDKQGHIVKRYLGEPEFSALDQLIEQQLQG